MVALDDDGFAGRMAALGPFERAPLLAVGVSGGADSLALVFLADTWARQRGGAAVALTVDHGLRPEAADEARQVGRWLAAHGIAHHILRHEGPRPVGDVQAVAREIRHSLLLDWCAGQGCLHLLLAHHRDDQAETLLLRLARGSGAGGLAGMAAVSYRPQARLLRPLLDVPRGDLEALLLERGQNWVRDPSNHDTGYARVRVRQAGALLAAEGLTADRLAATARRLGRVREAIEATADALLATAVTIDPRGWAWISPSPVRAAADEVALRLLADVLSAVGGRAHPPRENRLERVLADLGTAATLHGCRVVPVGQALLIVREARSVEICRGLRPADRVLWDGRFRILVAETAAAIDVAPLGPAGWRQVREATKAVPVCIPTAARATLPAVFDAKGLLSVPHLGYNREKDRPAGDWQGLKGLWFAPRRSAGSLGFRLARRRSWIM